ncbi:M23 family metallopeptidase [Gordonia shandongensis]|uniref:M23 family metallopeptidase n=1 Tax=Gordonia shandongensis TaxID=376351 RepID=UPI00316AD467
MAAKHRLRAPSSALKARTALFAIAAGATTIAVTGSASETTTSPITAAPSEPTDGTSTDGTTVSLAASGSDSDTGPGVVASSTEADFDGFTGQLAEGKRLAKAKAAREAAARRPLVASPINFGVYNLTSAFAPRWGAFHGGIDLAAPLGTPIHAATDGVVKEAGPAAGFGNWIQIQADDGTITVYGHMASSGVLVHKGQKVTAGDTIGLVGSEGFSTGPHCHFEVWKDGKKKIDPAPWLAKRGVRLSGLTG